MKPYSKRAKPTIRRMAKHWPTLMGTRQRVIDHLLFSIGTGCRWVDGCIVSEGDSPHGRIQRMRHEAERDKYFEDTHPVQSKVVKEALANSNLGWQERAKLVHWDIPCEYSPIMNVPEDVQPDWLAVCIEACEGFLASDPAHTSYPDHPKEYTKACKEIQAVLEKLKARQDDG